MRIRWVLFAVVPFLIFVGKIAHAQTSPKIDENRLTSLYEQLLLTPDNEYIQKRITEERAAVRTAIEEEMSPVLLSIEEEEFIGEAELTQALTQQRKVLATLNQRLSGRKADLDLILTEEKQFYLYPATATGVEVFRLTRSHGELLARKAILEERITLLESVMPLHERRIVRLEREQRLQQYSIFITIAKYVFVLILIWAFERLVRRNVLARIRDADRRYTATKIFTSIVFTLTALWIIAILLSRQPGILASLAIVGAGLAFALQDAVKDVLGWMLIMQGRILTKGDRVTIGALTGEVIDIGVLHSILLEVGLPDAPRDGVLERTGRTLSIPNAMLLTQPLINHSLTSAYIKTEMRITVTFESNWKKAREILTTILEEEAGMYARQERLEHLQRTWMYYIPHRTGGNLVHMTIAADGVEFTLRFSVPIGERRPVMSRVSDKILDRFHAEPDIDLAYRTNRAIVTQGAQSPYDVSKE